ncbi:MAG: DUF3848 domain-containing protein [Ruminiclostridium sp.]|nr:DUF3848 domain-containing protein [Ruminiclostridium sp.]
MKQDYCTALYEKIKSKHSQFIADLKTKPANDIILSAYEIVIKNEIMMYCENENPDLTYKQFKILLSRNALLDEVFECWCNNGELTTHDDIGITLEILVKLNQHLWHLMISQQTIE